MTQFMYVILFFCSFVVWEKKKEKKRSAIIIRETKLTFLAFEPIAV